MPQYPFNIRLAKARLCNNKIILANNVAVELLPGNLNRIGLTIHNRSNNDLYVRCAAFESSPASVENYDRIISPQSVYEWPGHEIPLTAINGIGINVTDGQWQISESVM